VAGENDYEDIYEVRRQAGGGVAVAGVHRGKGSKSPSRDSGSHSRSGSMSSTGSGGVTAVGSGSSVVVLHHTSATGTSVNYPVTVTNVTVDGSTAAVDDSIGRYEPVGTITPGTS